jgi:hypothetical protein
MTTCCELKPGVDKNINMTKVILISGFKKEAWINKKRRVR